MPRIFAVCTAAALIFSLGGFPAPVRADGDTAAAISATETRPKVSPNGRYFVDQKGSPVFWLGTTQWQLFREYKLADARTILEKTKENGPFVTNDYNLKPVKPVLMAEGAYEHGSEYGFDVTPLWVRRQAYYSYLADAHHTYGHNDSWRVLPTWKQALDAPGAVQMGILRKVIEARNEWWHLVPDQGIFASGGNTSGTVLNLAARHKDGKWLMVYLADKAAFAVDRSKLAPGKQARAFWIDPRTGKSVSIGEVPDSGTQQFTTPEGWEDALLILEDRG